MWKEMRRIRNLLMAVLLASPLALFAAQDVIGTITYMVGEASVGRNTTVLTREVRTGFEIQNMDLVNVARNGTVEIQLNANTGYSSRITIRGGSTLYFDLTSLQRSQNGNIELLQGSVALQVNRMPRGAQMNVRTGTASMGVRGTVFDVNIAAGGDILLSTEEGLVACTTQRGETFFSEPGKVVQALSGDWAEIPIAVSALGQFRSNWVQERVSALKANYPRAIENFAGRYAQLRLDFADAYNKLMSNRALIQKWIQEDQQNRIGSTIEILREKRQIIGALLDVRRVLVQWERVYFRVLELQEYFDSGETGDGVLSSGQTYSQFFRQLNGEKASLATRMQEIRYIIKLYALRNNGSTPLDAFGN